MADVVDDKREDILVRLLAVLTGVAGVKTAERNVKVLDDWVLPAGVLLDGDEQADEGAFGRNRPGETPNLVHMSPQVFVKIADNVPDVGTALNVFRRRVIKAVLFDPGLKTLTGPNGAICYEGLGTALAAGRTMLGEAAFTFTLTYVLKPADL